MKDKATEADHECELVPARPTANEALAWSEGLLRGAFGPPRRCLLCGGATQKNRRTHDDKPWRS